MSLLSNPVKSMNDAMKHNSYDSRNTVAVRTPNNGNDTINDNNNNQSLPDKNYTLCITNTNSLHINKTNGLCRSRKVKKPPSYLNCVKPEIGVRACFNVILMMLPLMVIKRIKALL